MKNPVILFCLVCLAFGSYSQNKLSSIDSVNINRADSIARILLGNKVEKSNYLLLIINKKLLLVNRVKSSYDVYRGDYLFDYNRYKIKISKLKTESISKSQILKRCFTQQICDPPFSYVSNDSLLIENDNWGPAYYYFTVNKFGSKVCEINLPLTLSIPINKKKSFPLDKDVLKYLVRLMKLFPY